MATTTNFGWETPDDTDLVKDGAAAMRTLGNAIDTSFVDLKGGTTGQVLAKASNTDLDFTWSADATGIPATIFDAKGDIIAATAADTASRLAVGTNGHVLTADSTAATGLKWAAVSTTKSFSLLNTGGTALTGATTITYTLGTTVDEILVVINGASAGASSQIRLQINADSNGYHQAGTRLNMDSTYNIGMQNAYNTTTGSAIDLGYLSTNAASAFNGYVRISGCATTGLKAYVMGGGSTVASGVQMDGVSIAGGISDSGGTAITSISLLSGSGNFDAGTLYVYGAV